MNKKRLTNIDLLKILCIISVIIIHVSSYNLEKIIYSNIDNSLYFIINIFNNITRFSVPCFIMITGMFILDKDITIKEILKKYILKIVIVFILFCSIYAIYNYQNDLSSFNNYYYFGAYHLWYLILLIGLYLITPILKLIVKDNKITKYFLIINLILTFLTLFIIPLINKASLNNISTTLISCLPLSYTFYYVAGYYLSKNKINKPLIYTLGLIGTIINIIIFYHFKYNKTLYENIYLLPSTIFQSISIFILFKNLKIKNNYIINYISKHVFSIYLIHLLIIKIILNYNTRIIYSLPLLTIPFISIFVFLVSLLISITLKSIPILKKIL